MNTSPPSPVEQLQQSLPLFDRPWGNPPGLKREAAVLVALTDEAMPRVILGRRARHLPLHPGEVAFPGGKREAGDATAWITAAREAREEIGLPEACVERLGELAPLVTRTQFEVHPCVARVPSTFDMVVDPGEFDSVFLTPLEVFADSEVYRLEPMNDGNKQRMVPHYQVADDNIWGVTAAILATLANLAYDAGLDLRPY